MQTHTISYLTNDVSGYYWFHALRQRTITEYGFPPCARPILKEDTALGPTRIRGLQRKTPSIVVITPFQQVYGVVCTTRYTLLDARHYIQTLAYTQTVRNIQQLCRVVKTKATLFFLFFTLFEVIFFVFHFPFFILVYYHLFFFILFLTYISERYGL